MKTCSPLRSAQAFTLVELLTVITIMALLATFASTALTDAARTSRMNNGAEMLSAALNEARALAVARGGTTEFRIISQSSSAAPRFLQTVLVREDGSSLPLTRTQTLPEGVIVAPGTSYSGVLNLAPQTIPSGQPMAGATYRSIRFGARGEPRDSTGSILSDPDNFLTLVAERDYRPGALPSHWIALQIDDRTGAVRRFQP